MIVTVDVGLACGFWRYLATPTIVKTLQIRFLRDSQVRGITNIIGICNVLQRIKFIFLISDLCLFRLNDKDRQKSRLNIHLFFIFLQSINDTAAQSFQQFTYFSYLFPLAITFPTLLHTHKKRK